MAVVVAAALLISPSVASAQTSSINTYSPYSMYGLGDLHSQGTLSMRAMGGAGVALRNPAEINILNPASYSITLNKSVLLNYGLEGANFYNTQNSSAGKKSNSYATMNFHNFALQMPIAKKMGASLSVSPYSSVGYNINGNEKSTNIGLINYNYSGNGDVTQVKLGFGWEPIKDLSFGVAAIYYWGTLQRMFTMEPIVITGNGNYNSTMGTSNYIVSKIQPQVGIQWSAISTSKRRLNFGATYDFGGDIDPNYSFSVIGNSDLISVIAKQDTVHMSLATPKKLAAGVHFQTPKMTVSADYSYEDWRSGNTRVEETATEIPVAYNNFGFCKVGVEYTPKATDIRNYFNRIAYRFGARYGGYQYTYGNEQLSQYAVTAGFGFPIKMGGISRIDVGVEYGGLGSCKEITYNSSSMNLIRQNYFKFSLGFSLFGEDYWFQRPKFD